MTIPHIFRIGALVLVTTAFYTYVGQMVPQKEVAPPEDATIGSEMTTADMVKVGREVMSGKGLCLTCHTVGKTGALRFPDLQGVAVRAKTRVQGMSDVEYLAQSLYEPMAYVVPGFPPAMPPMHQPPFSLTDQEILCVIAALQTYGGTPTVTLQTTHKYLGQSAPPGATATPAPAPESGDAPAGDAATAEPKKGADAQPGATPHLVAVHRLPPVGRHRLGYGAQDGASR